MLENALLVCLMAAMAWYLFLMPRILSARWANPPEALPAVNWHSGHAVAIFLLFIGLSAVAGKAAYDFSLALGYDESSQVPFGVTIVLVYALNVVTFLLIAAIAGRSGPASGALGFKSAPIPASVKAGLTMFLVFLPLQAAFPMIVDTIWAALFHEAPKEQEAVEVFMNAGPALLVLVSFAAVVVAPFFEELIFRAFIQKGLENNLGRPAAILITAGLFAAAHGGIATGIKVLPLALVLSVAYDRTRNIVPNIVFHAAFNAASLAVALIARDEGLDLGLVGP
jgi:membrane protease YdiL (CAAX protease family)